MKRSYFYFSLAALVLILDRISKYAVITNCFERCQINNYVAFDVAFNRGISWGFFHSQSELLFVSVSVLIAVITCNVAYLWVHEFKRGSSVVGQTLIVAGSLGNLIDRFWYHGVIDFIELSYGLYVWPLFNVADVCIVMGVGIMLVEYYRS